MTAKTPILDANAVSGLLEKLAKALQQEEARSGAFALVGIHTRGIPLAKRLAQLLGRDSEKIGTLDINLYRDDLSTAGDMPVVRETKIPFPIDGINLLLVDDVLYTGRTIRSALDALADLGRPKQIKLLVLIDRGGRELPIQPDFCGKELTVQEDENIKVRLKEVDSHDGVEILKR